MKLDKIFGPQTWYVIFIVGGIIWLGWFLSSDLDQKITGGTNTNDTKPAPSTISTPPPEFGVVSEVIDSLTIVIDNKFVVRYLGVTTPTTLDKVECFGKEALQANESLAGKTVRLEEDPILTRAIDKAWVRYVWVAEDETSQDAYAQALSGAPIAGLNMPAEAVDSPEATPQDEVQAEENKIKEYLVSERIIEMGLGFPLLSKDMTYHEKLSAAARFSSATKRGLWGACEIQESENGLLKTQDITECTIKGVKLLNGQQIFRTPECQGYKDTVVRQQQGDEWLCSEEAAVEKGYTKAIDC